MGDDRITGNGLVPSASSSAGDPLPCAAVGAAGVAAQSLTDIYQQHVRLLRLIAVRDFRVPFGDAESIVHDIFTRYFSNPGIVRGELKPYFRGAVRNECLDYWRKRQREESVFCDADGSEPGEVCDDLSLADSVAVRLDVAATLSRLRPRCRDALRRFHLEGKSMLEVAAEMDVAPLYVRQLLHHCRKAARVVFESITRVES